MPLPEPTCSQTPDGTYVFEAVLGDGTRLAAVVLPEEIDEVTGAPTSETPDADERRRRFQAARLLAEIDLREQEALRRLPDAGLDAGA